MDQPERPPQGRDEDAVDQPEKPPQGRDESALDQPERPPRGSEEDGVDPPRLALLLLVLFPFLLIIVLGLLFGWLGR